MTQIVEPNPIYHTLTEEEVRKALTDPDETNPVAIELTRLVASYTTNCVAQFLNLGYVPPHLLLHITPRWPIEKVAMEITAETIRSAMSESTGNKDG